MLSRASVAKLTLLGRAHGIHFAGLGEEHGEGETAGGGDDRIAFFNEGCCFDAGEDGDGLGFWMSALTGGVEACGVDGAGRSDEQGMRSTAGCKDNLAFGSGGEGGGEVGGWVEEVGIPHCRPGRFGGGGDALDRKTALTLFVATDDVGVSIDGEEDGVTGRVRGEDALHADIGD